MSLREPAKFDQLGLGRFERKAELAEPFAQSFLEERSAPRSSLGGSCSTSYQRGFIASATTGCPPAPAAKPTCARQAAEWPPQCQQSIHRQRTTPPIRKPQPIIAPRARAALRPNLRVVEE